MDGTIFLGSERTTENPTDNGAFGDGLGQGFENGITEDSLKHAEFDERQGNGWPGGVLTPNNFQETNVRPLGDIFQ